MFNFPLWRLLILHYLLRFPTFFFDMDLLSWLLDVRLLSFLSDAPRKSSIRIRILCLFLLNVRFNLFMFYYFRLFRFWVLLFTRTDFHFPQSLHTRNFFCLWLLFFDWLCCWFLSFYSQRLLSGSLLLLSFSFLLSLLSHSFHSNRIFSFHSFDCIVVIRVA